MDRNVRALMIALLCVLAVSVAAATLANPQADAGAGSGVGSAIQSGTDDQSGDDESDTESSAQSPPITGEPINISGACFPFLLSPTFLGGAAVALGGLAWWLKRRDGLLYATAVVLPVTLFLAPLYFVLTDCGTGTESPSQDPALLPEMANGSSSGDLGGEVGGQAANQLLSPTVLFAVLVVVAVLFALLAYRASGDDEAEAEPVDVAETPEPADRDALSAVGAAAGEAADRIENEADVENEVYRAWRDMTDHVDVPDPQTSTPREFATAARDAGMDAVHVDDLTDLFREVRYGGADPTADREQRAVDALRAIEDRYAGGDQ